MKTLTSALLMSMAMLSAGAYASQNIEPNNVPFQGVYGQQDQAKSSAQVKEDLTQAKANGQYTFGENDYPPVAAVSTSGKTRQQVKDELAQAKANGDYTFGDLDYPPHAN
ncbi:DUF4148 domain-containing protein [Bordetella hinzii]|uniref:PF13663 domain protein n=1 Tax=Bordetella hinzii OH87 BAL007II TaxID=1331262 RepID=A0ABR4R1G1_9BORD|nr:DUF4148 domain-containing protein [Bordetella hinzii]KCB24498.1 PF13663 domain protein [Bordetella hinzii OH87 BAL007II]KCB30853.1 PF13663 domain protein [Bordetella hinzii CA90 BAL1384]KCB39395.1 PF13663 domain protein [Bordetella hinzii 5132]QDJ43403.1 hypothetical protein CBR70_20030 [Bordetella hinzii]QDJ47977.1 hypothetical protein CBR71_20295 [Bordetella hinzii]